MVIYWFWSPSHFLLVRFLPASCSNLRIFDYFCVIIVIINIYITRKWISN